MASKLDGPAPRSPCPRCLRHGPGLLLPTDRRHQLGCQAPFATFENARYGGLDISGRYRRLQSAISSIECFGILYRWLSWLDDGITSNLNSTWRELGSIGLSVEALLVKAAGGVGGGAAPSGAGARPQRPMRACMRLHCEVRVHLESGRD